MDMLRTKQFIRQHTQKILSSQANEVCLQYLFHAVSVSKFGVSANEIIGPMRFSRVWNSVCSCSVLALASLDFLLGAGCRRTNVFLIKLTSIALKQYV